MMARHRSALSRLNCHMQLFCVPSRVSVKALLPCRQAMWTEDCAESHWSSQSNPPLTFSVRLG